MLVDFAVDIMICFRVVHLHVVICYTNLFFAFMPFKIQHRIKILQTNFSLFLSLSNNIFIYNKSVRRGKVITTTTTTRRG